MILGKFWGAISAQLNKIANMFWEADPIAQMQLEHDRALEQMKEGRKGLELYRGLVERVNRLVITSRAHVQKLEVETKAYLKIGNRETAAKFALELQKAKQELAGHLEQRVIQDRIDVNRGKARVASDLSNEGIADIEAQEQMHKSMADDALLQFESELGLRSPETTKLADTQKDLGPAVAESKLTEHN